MLNTEERKFAIEDARLHVSALLDLIKFHDQKALSLLSLYVTLGIATVGLSLTGFSKEPMVGASASYGLSAASVSLFVGAIFCFRTIEGSEVTIPGRGFEFWNVALTQPGDSFEAATRTYIVDWVSEQTLLRNLNRRIARHMRVAKFAGIAAPAAAAIVGLGAEFLLPLISPYMGLYPL